MRERRARAGEDNASAWCEADQGARAETPSFLELRRPLSSSARVSQWHLGHFKKEYLPWMRGFDNFFGYLSDQLWYYNHKSPHACKGTYCFYDMNHNGANAENSIGVYSTFLFTDVVQQILEESDPADPLMVYLSWQNVHAPLDPPPESYFQEDEISLLGMIDDPYRRTFASMTIILDNAMKKIVGQMQSLGYYDNSVMLVMSDNGGCPYSGGYNYPLRGAKQYLFEGGIRVNAFVHSPNLIPDHARGRHYEGMVHVSDWLPTLLYGVADVSPDALDRALDGVDHWKHMVSPELFASADKYPRQEILHNIDLWSLDTQFHNVSLLETPVAGDDAEAPSLSLAGEPARDARRRAARRRLEARDGPGRVGLVRARHDVVRRGRRVLPADVRDDRRLQLPVPPEYLPLQHDGRPARGERLGL